MNKTKQTKTKNNANEPKDTNTPKYKHTQREIDDKIKQLNTKAKGDVITQEGAIKILDHNKENQKRYGGKTK